MGEDLKSELINELLDDKSGRKSKKHSKKSLPGVGQDAAFEAGFGVINSLAFAKMNVV